MQALRRLLYIGTDSALYERLAQAVKARQCCLGWVENPDRLMTDLRTIPSWNQLGVEPEKFEARFRQRYAAVIIDLDLPYGKISPLIRTIRRFDASISTIVLSSSDDIASVYMARLDGAAGYFTKPIISLDPLLEEIDKSRLKQQHWETIVKKMAGIETPHFEVVSNKSSRDLSTTGDANNHIG